MTDMEWIMSIVALAVVCLGVAMNEKGRLERPFASLAPAGGCPRVTPSSHVLVHLPADELVEVHHAVLHRALIRPVLLAAIGE
jgi:hypothetical protein